MMIVTWTEKGRARSTVTGRWNLISPSPLTHSRLLHAHHRFLGEHTKFTLWTHSDFSSFSSEYSTLLYLSFPISLFLPPPHFSSLLLSLSLLFSPKFYQVYVPWYFHISNVIAFIRKANILIKAVKSREFWRRDPYSLWNSNTPCLNWSWPNIIVGHTLLPETLAACGIILVASRQEGWMFTNYFSSATTTSPLDLVEK